jgi:hypothetical protein
MRRNLNDALDFGRRLQSTHFLQSASNTISSEDIISLLNVSEVDADAQPKKATLQQVIDATNAVKSNTSGITGSDQITNMVSLTQAEYNAIVSPAASTFYIITP